ncbi:glycoside hydrolase, partial [Acinetobacter baumannii]|nr:glycoside hydrolase [Acinetobacter baumannii]
TKLRDGRLCCVFGYRTARRMVATFSADEGRTWGEQVILRDDFQVDVHGEPDFGYARACQRADGQMIAIYYWATAALPHQHIAATIWQPER